ncbi:hypothetical protein NY78_0993 [Desulfovibrio sp. TomC]|nr:hypothetical protein NY78_0993 [Desulfovibrio sp. TomC]
MGTASPRPAKVEEEPDCPGGKAGSVARAGDVPGRASERQEADSAGQPCCRMANLRRFFMQENPSLRIKRP